MVETWQLPAICHIAGSVPQPNSHTSPLTELPASISSTLLCSFHTTFLSSPLLSVSSHKKSLISEDSFNVDLQRILPLLPSSAWLCLCGKGFELFSCHGKVPSHPPSPHDPVSVILSSNIDRSLPIVFTGFHLRFPVTCHCINKIFSLKICH